MKHEDRASNDPRVHTVMDNQELQTQLLDMFGYKSIEEAAIIHESRIPEDTFELEELWTTLIRETWAETIGDWLPHQVAQWIKKDTEGQEGAWGNRYLVDCFIAFEMLLQRRKPNGYPIEE